MKPDADATEVDFEPPAPDDLELSEEAVEWMFDAEDSGASEALLRLLGDL